MSVEDENPVEAAAADVQPDIPEVPEISAEEAAANREAALVRGLHAYFRRHNLQALILALFSLVTAAILWGAIYAFVFWFSLVGVTLKRSFNPATLLQVNDPNLLGRYFPWYFAGFALCLLVVAGFARRRFRPERLRDARFYVLWLLAEIVLAVPNATFAVWGNLSAITRLRREDAVAAAHLLQRIEDSDGGVSYSRLRVEIPDERTLFRVLFTLQLGGLVGLRERERGWFYCLEKPGTIALLQQAG